MEIKSKLVQLLPLQTGEGKNGQWKKQDIIVETEGEYPKKICISIWGDKINESQLQIGNQLNVSFDIESREYNGRWYTDVKAWKIEAVGNSGSSTPTSNSSNSASVNEIKAPEMPAVSDESDDLPF